MFWKLTRKVDGIVLLMKPEKITYSIRNRLLSLKNEDEEKYNETNLSHYYE